jgi:hypothetical protein
MNNAQTMKYNLKNGHIMRSAMMIGGTAVSGMLRIYILKEVLGQTLPGENSDWWKYFQTVMWQGEFFGITSELFSPYKGSQFSLDGNVLFNSALLTHTSKGIGLMSTLTGHYTGAWETAKTPGAALNEFFRATSSSYNNIYKRMNQRNNEYNRNYKAIRSWIKDYEGKHGLFQDSNNIEAESTKYLKNVTTSFNLSDFNTKKGVDEFNEAITLAYFAYASDRMNAGYSYEQSLKLADGMISRKLKTLSPVIGSESPGQKGRIISPAEGFLVDLDEDKMKVIRSAYSEYKKKIAIWEKQYPYYLRKTNLEEVTGRFKFGLAPRLQRSIDKALLK